MGNGDETKMILKTKIKWINGLSYLYDT